MIWWLRCNSHNAMSNEQWFFLHWFHLKRMECWGIFDTERESEACRMFSSRTDCLMYTLELDNITIHVMIWSGVFRYVVLRVMLSNVLLRCFRWNNVWARKCNTHSSLYSHFNSAALCNVGILTDGRDVTHCSPRCVEVYVWRCAMQLLIEEFWWDMIPEERHETFFTLCDLRYSSNSAIRQKVTTKIS